MNQLEEFAEVALRQALKEGASDASVLCSGLANKIVRFSNNLITVSKDFENISIWLYVGKNQRRMVGGTFNPDKNAVGEFTSRLVKACSQLSPSPEYTSLPQGRFTYPSQPDYDPEVAEGGDHMAEFVGLAIESALSEGAVRVSGTLETRARDTVVLTSGGAEGADRGTTLLLNVRAFSDGSSGHGLSCACTFRGFEPGEVGRTAGRYAKASSNPRELPEGIYDVILAPTVSADIIQHVGGSASAFSVEAGYSFLAEKVGRKIASDTFTMTDVGVMPGGLAGRSFDDEGVPTRRNVILESGILKGYLHNTTTARKFKTSPTGNAGIIDPHPWNLVVEPGDQSIEEMIESLAQGVLVTNNWYTRFQNMWTGEYSTLPRDAAFLIEKGEIKHPVRGIRLSDSIPRQLSNIQSMSKDRKWIEWWEVSVPTLAPAMLIKGVPVTRAIG